MGWLCSWALKPFTTYRQECQAQVSEPRQQPVQRRLVSDGTSQNRLLLADMFYHQALEPVRPVLVNLSLDMDLNLRHKWSPEILSWRRRDWRWQDCSFRFHYPPAWSSVQADFLC